ncbi:MAG: hypothetical protein AB7G68_07400 [Nitrospiraceae bacterium]
MNSGRKTVAWNTRHDADLSMQKRKGLAMKGSRRADLTGRRGQITGLCIIPLVVLLSVPCTATTDPVPVPQPGPGPTDPVPKPAEPRPVPPLPSPAPPAPAPAPNPSPIPPP